CKSPYKCIVQGLEYKCKHTNSNGDRSGYGWNAAEHAIITIAPPVAPKFQKELRNRFIISFLLVS
ncbi:MAG: hypothetical protein ACTJGL_03165, partial [Vreelandella alkaliphila]